MRFTEARNDKPPSGGNGGLTRLVGSLTLGMQVKRDGSLTDCSSPVNHPATQPLDMGQICQRRADHCGRAGHRLPKSSGPKRRGYTGIRLASLPSKSMGGRGAITGLPSIRGGKTWVG
ncbi:MAG: hypothetical protein EBV32_03970 [Proteobacteria bacterium]|uniref:Uncharacterized protein n=1 Tax=Candidatus Fonsibacter lacus TaxID=2576439 RepID=A0A964V149_9PROT|nr:hypothetical protein [Candidatus Fonsibacter lacus]NCU72210.1 hypothetical protein [Candidatus Fonsibacter lacus]